jgi:hypothetical protein
MGVIVLGIKWTSYGRETAMYVQYVGRECPLSLTGSFDNLREDLIDMVAGL